MTTQTEPDRPALRLTLHQKYVRRIENLCRTDPGARIALRKGLRRALDDGAHTRGMHRLITPWLPQGAETPETEQRAYYTIAALIAAQPRYSFAADGPEDEPAAEAGNQPAAEPQNDPGQDADGESEPAAAVIDPAASPPGSAQARRRSSGSSLGIAFARAVAEAPGREREMRLSTAESRLNLLTRQSVNGLHRHLPASVGYLRGLDVPVDWARLLGDLIGWQAGSGRISRRWLQDFYWSCAQSDRDKAAKADGEEAAAEEAAGPPE
ncbi:type I-E CRISPR-associated protein Cse2/CasB [Actinacidiphila sp. ITFR-21]|uniref:type I-E CRISPR-associated protein Cse2/CasB n=1 Tax=Actinacidiphila sp. ITFR-21 TaxID=3075199 RepID=UPI00288C1D46|nr:type I-E CRISPR-associated protein Cse2/CasB [Streptomyces sp. ITFR-21]WNI18723.1 type I-E CRISPR-associated protein Cse2/CasB [Streptomyces sp. ITFR-21]